MSDHLIVLLEGIPNEAYISKSTDYDVGHKDEEIAEEQVTPIVLRVLCVSKDGHTDHMKEVARAEYASCWCVIVADQSYCAQWGLPVCVQRLLLCSDLERGVLKCFKAFLHDVDDEQDKEHNTC